MRIYNIFHLPAQGHPQALVFPLTTFVIVSINFITLKSYPSRLQVIQVLKPYIQTYGTWVIFLESSKSSYVGCIGLVRKRWYFWTTILIGLLKPSFKNWIAFSWNLSIIMTTLPTQLATLPPSHPWHNFLSQLSEEIAMLNF